MNRREFYEIARELFDGTLRPVGFSRERSDFSTYYRQAGDDIYHLVVPDLGSRGVWYDVKVFPTSPHLQPLFQSRFPDALQVTTDRWSYLSEEGVGMTQGRFNCKYEDNFRRRFQNTVKPLLINVALPYLDKIQTMEDVIPLLKNACFLGSALHYVGRRDEARVLLEQERKRLLQLDTREEIVAAWVERVNQLLATCPQT
jgi:hypothetical protein